MYYEVWDSDCCITSLPNKRCILCIWCNAVLVCLCMLCIWCTAEIYAVSELSNYNLSWIIYYTDVVFRTTFYSNFDCLQKDHEQRQQRQQREGPHMVRPQEERVRSTDDWLGAAISAASPLSSTPYTRGQRVSMMRMVFYVLQFLKQTFPVYTFHKQSYEMSCLSVCPVTLKKSAVTDSYLVWRLHLTCNSVIFLIRGDWIRAQLHHHIPPTLSQNSFTKTNDNIHWMNIFPLTVLNWYFRYTWKDQLTLMKCSFIV